MRLFICDDEEVFSNRLAKKIDGYFRTINVGFTIFKFNNPKDLLKNIGNNSIVFLDISMPEMDGFEVAAKIREKYSETSIIFVTNKEELVYQSFAYKPVSFIRKNYLDEELFGVLKRLADVRRFDEAKYVVTVDREKKILLIKDIVYVESCKNYVDFVMSSERVTLRSSIGSVENSFLKFGFIRTHSGYLVNYRCITKFTKESIVLKSGELLPVSRSKYPEAVEQWYRLLGGINE